VLADRPALADIREAESLMREGRTQEEALVRARGPRPGQMSCPRAAPLDLDARPSERSAP
jgi:hypothetical protein